MVEELGRAVAPGPFLPTTTQFAPLVRELGSAEQRARFLGGVADGSVTGTLGIVEAGHGIGLAGLATTATETAEGLVLDGAKEFVLEAPVGRRDRGGRAARGVRRRRRGRRVRRPRRRRRRSSRSHAFDATRGLGRVVLDGVPCPADRVLGTPGLDHRRSASSGSLHEAAMGVAVESVGTCQTIFDITLDYAKQREQFGVPIGSFQAIKHKFADLLVALEQGAGRRPTSPRSRSPRTTSGARIASSAAKVGGRRLRADDEQGGHPAPRRHRLHVGARHAPLRAARRSPTPCSSGARASTASASPGRSASDRTVLPSRRPHQARVCDAKTVTGVLEDR